MKFPFDFSLTLVFRLVFPGIVLAVVLWPVIATLLNMAGIEHDPKIALPVAAVILGWLIVLADQPIYMLYEGRRWWPTWLQKIFVDWESACLKTVSERADKLYARGDDNYLEYEIDKLDFPLDDDGKPYAAFPSRLGNIVTAFETYSKSAWGVDSIFYWPRLWVVLDKDTRSVLDDSQAIADSAVYVSFALSIGVLVFLAYGIGGYVAIIPGWRRFDLPNLPAPCWTLLIAGILFVLARVIYWLALFQQRSYGELFKSLFDQYRDKLSFVSDATDIALAAGTARQEVLDSKHAVAALYLRWHRIRPAGQVETASPEEWAAKKSAPPSGP